MYLSALFAARVHRAPFIDPSHAGDEYDSLFVLEVHQARAALLGDLPMCAAQYPEYHRKQNARIVHG